MLGALTYTLSMASLVRERDSNFRGNVPPPPPYLVGLDSRLERGKQRQINHTEAKKLVCCSPHRTGCLVLVSRLCIVHLLTQQHMTLSVS